MKKPSKWLYNEGEKVFFVMVILDQLPLIRPSEF